MAATRWSVTFIYAVDSDEDTHSLVGHGFIIEGIEKFCELMSAIQNNDEGKAHWCFMQNADGSSEVINLNRVNAIRIKDLD